MSPGSGSRSRRPQRTTLTKIRLPPKCKLSLQRTRPLGANWKMHRSQYERSSECLHVWYRSVVLRGVRDRVQADCRQCSRWDEQARLLQHGSFADHHLPIAHLCRSIKDPLRPAIASPWPPTVSTDGRRPHQFRTRNNLIRTKSNKSALKSTNPIDIPPLITVWLQVRVLPGAPAFARFASYGWASQHRSFESEAGEGCHAVAHRAKAGRAPLPTKISKTTPCKVTGWPRAGMPPLRKQFDTSGKSAARFHGRALPLLQRPSNYRCTFDLTMVSAS